MTPDPIGEMIEEIRDFSIALFKTIVMGLGIIVIVLAIAAISML